MTILEIYKEDFLNYLKDYDDFNDALYCFMSMCEENLAYDHAVDIFYNEHQQEIDAYHPYHTTKVNAKSFADLKRAVCLEFLQTELSDLFYEVAA